MLTRLHHVGVHVGATPAVVEVLEGLGLQTVEAQLHPEVGLQIVHLQGQGVNVELLRVVGQHSPVARDPKGLHHLAFETRCLAEAFRRLQEDPRVDVLGPPRRGAHGCNVLLFRLRDEPSLLLELVEVAEE